MYLLQFPTKKVYYTWQIFHDNLQRKIKTSFKPGVKFSIYSLINGFIWRHGMQQKYIIFHYVTLKALAKRTHKSTQVNASLQNQNLRTDCEEWPNGFASRLASRKKTRKFHAYHWLMRFYNNRLLAINLYRLALRGRTVKNLRLLTSKFELDQSRRKWVAKRNASWAQVQNLRRLASPFGQGLSSSKKRQVVKTGMFRGFRMTLRVRH